MNDSGSPSKPSLPPFVDAARADVSEDPDAAEVRGAAMMNASADAIVSGVAERGAPYVTARAVSVLDAWNRAQGANESDANAVDEVRRAAERARDRVVSELQTLLATDPDDQVRTPLEIVRTLRSEPTEVLQALGVGEVARDEFEERVLPDDPYGLAPHTLSELGDDDLGPMLLAWGIGKSMVLRARAVKRRSAATGAERAATTRGDEEGRNPMRSAGSRLRDWLARGRGTAGSGGNEGD